MRAGDQGERSLRGQVPARLGALAAGDRAGRGRAGRRARSRGGRARLHRQGQRPAPLRALLQGDRSRPARDRSAARPDLDARRGDRVRAGQGHPRPGDAGLAVLDRREPLRPRDRGGRARGSRGRRRPRSRTRSRATPRQAPEPVEVTIGFEAGVPVSLDGEELPLAELIARLNALAGPLRDRPDRHDREPRRRDQEPRGVRGAGRDRADRRRTPRSRTSC